MDYRKSKIFKVMKILFIPVLLVLTACYGLGGVVILSSVFSFIILTILLPMELINHKRGSNGETKK